MELADGCRSERGVCTWGQLCEAESGSIITVNISLPVKMTVGGGLTLLNKHTQGAPPSDGAHSELQAYEAAAA